MIKEIKITREDVQKKLNELVVQVCEINEDLGAELGTYVDFAGEFSDQLESKFRLETFLTHTCLTEYKILYGDDGELMCNTCRTDFKRLPIGELMSVLEVIRMKRYTKEHNESNTTRTT